MLIGVDAGLAAYRRGMGNYVFSLLEELRRVDSAHEFIVYDGRDPVSVVSPNRSWRAVSVGPANYPIREQLSLPLRCTRDRTDLLHCPANTCPLVLPRQIKLVVTIHDVMFMMPHSELPASASIYHRAGALYRRITARHAARRADAIIAVSRKSASDIERYLGVPAERIRVIHEAPASRFRRFDSPSALGAVRAAGVTGRFILALGGADPRKNTRRAIEAFAAAAKFQAKGLKLVVVGLSPRSIPTFGEHAERCGVGGEVVFTAFVPEETLVAMYKAAEMFLYPSLYEGFGLPVLEAMACGTPVIASTAGSLPEVAADAAVLVDPSDICAIADAIGRVATDAEFHTDLIRRGSARARLFSWERAASQTIRVYEECLRA